MEVATHYTLLTLFTWFTLLTRFTLTLGKPTRKKSAVFFNIVQKAFDPPPFYLNICPILQGVCFGALKMVVILQWPE